MFLKAVLSVVLVAALFATVQAEVSLPAQGIKVAHTAINSNHLEKRQADFGTCTQNQLVDIFENYPSDCAETLQAIESLDLQNPDPDQLASIYDDFCPPRCSEPVFRFYRTCGFRDLETIASGFCGCNADGERCYNLLQELDDGIADVVAECPSVSNCSSSCQTAVQGFSSSGCCVNIFNNTFDILGNLTIADDFALWNECGVPVPVPRTCSSVCPLDPSPSPSPSPSSEVTGSAALLHFSYLLSALLLMAAASMMY